jgi:hypothetical protein
MPATASSFWFLLEQGSDQSGPVRIDKAGCAAFVSLSSQMIALSGVLQGAWVAADNAGTVLAWHAGRASESWACSSGG